MIRGFILAYFAFLRNIFFLFGPWVLFSQKWVSETKINVYGLECDRCVRLTTKRHLWADYLDNVVYLISHNPVVIHELFTGLTLPEFHFLKFIYLIFNHIFHLNQTHVLFIAHVLRAQHFRPPGYLAPHVGSIFLKIFWYDLLRDTRFRQQSAKWV
jgi:hypothetical protein